MGVFGWETMLMTPAFVAVTKRICDEVFLTSMEVIFASLK
jgi:hypothetical protein